MNLNQASQQWAARPNDERHLSLAEEGEARSLWDIINGATAFARQIPHTDERVKIEAVAGKLMQVVA